MGVPHNWDPFRHPDNDRLGKVLVVDRPNYTRGHKLLEVFTHHGGHWTRLRSLSLLLGAWARDESQWYGWVASLSILPELLQTLA